MAAPGGAMHEITAPGSAGMDEVQETAQSQIQDDLNVSIRVIIVRI